MISFANSPRQLANHRPTVFRAPSKSKQFSIESMNCDNIDFYSNKHNLSAFSDGNHATHWQSVSAKNKLEFKLVQVAGWQFIKRWLFVFNSKRCAGEPQQTRVNQTIKHSELWIHRVFTNRFLKSQVALHYDAHHLFFRGKVETTLRIVLLIQFKWWCCKTSVCNHKSTRHSFARGKFVRCRRQLVCGTKEPIAVHKTRQKI